MAETVNLGSSQQRGGVSARGGSNHNAERPVQLPYPQGPVVGRGIGISPEERWCTPCRGLHDPAKVNNPNWQPYSIRKRMYGLNLLQTQFLGAAQTGTLPVKLDGNNPRKIKWFHCNANGDVLAPSTMTEEEYKWFLPLMLDGCREQHEPHRYLAFQAAKEMIDAAGARLLPCVPYVIRPISIGLQTMEPSLVGVQIFLLQRMLKANQWMGKALAPYYHKMLPLMNLFKHRHDLKIMVPPPRCTPATGTRTGHEAAKDRKGRVCNVCGTLVDPPLHQEKSSNKAGNAPLIKSHSGRPFQRLVMAQLIADTLEVMEMCSGEAGLQEIRKYLPAWGMGGTRLRVPAHPGSTSSLML
eukprot:jgi/Tetstr1/461167/TSEL_006304.t1